MTDPWHMLGPQGKSDRPVWLFAAGVAFVLLALAIGSALSYTSIVVAQATVSISPSTSLTLQGTNSDGTLTPDGSLTASLSLRVDNPSSRVLRLQLLAFTLDGTAHSVEVGMLEHKGCVAVAVAFRRSEQRSV